MARAEALRDQKLEPLPEQLVTRIPEHFLCLDVHEANAAVWPDDDHGIGCRIEQQAVQQVAVLPARFGAHRVSRGSVSKLRCASTRFRDRALTGFAERGRRACLRARWPVALTALMARCSARIR